MEKIDILLWIVGCGFTITFAMMKMIWTEIKLMRTELKSDIKDVSEKLTDVDRRLCRLEGAFSSKECCMLKENRHHKKAE
jgi:hypothetical protein